MTITFQRSGVELLERRRDGNWRDLVGALLERRRDHLDGTFTATDGVETSGSVTVNAGGYNDLARQYRRESGSDTVAIDTKNPTASVNIVDTLLNDSDPSSQVIITFSEAVTGFSNADVTVTGGTLSRPQLERRRDDMDGNVYGDRRGRRHRQCYGGRSLHRYVGNTGATGANDVVTIDRFEASAAVNDTLVVSTGTFGYGFSTSVLTGNESREASWLFRWGRPRVASGASRSMPQRRLSRIMRQMGWAREPHCRSPTRLRAMAPSATVNV